MLINIKPKKAVITDSFLCNQCDLNITFDDMETMAVFSFALKNAESQIVSVNGTLTISGDEYKNWSGRNEDSLNYVLSKLPITQI